jgi:hypothetical protein
MQPQEFTVVRNKRSQKGPFKKPIQFGSFSYASHATTTPKPKMEEFLGVFNTTKYSPSHLSFLIVSPSYPLSLPFLFIDSLSFFFILATRIHAM